MGRPSEEAGQPWPVPRSDPGAPRVDPLPASPSGPDSCSL